MKIVTLTVMIFGGSWCVKVVDNLGTRFVGASSDRAPIVALALQLAQDAFLEGAVANLNLPPEMKAA